MLRNLFRKNVWCVCLAAIGVGCASANALALFSADLTLVKKGAAQVELILVEGAHEDEELAAQEIQAHVFKISGAELPIARAGAASGKAVAIRIGAAADADLDAVIREKGDDPGSFVLVVDKNGVQIRGLSPRGTLCGAVRDGDFHTGSSFDIPNLYPPELRVRARKLLADAPPTRAAKTLRRWSSNRGRGPRASREGFSQLKGSG